MWDLIVSVPDHCLSFYFKQKNGKSSGPDDLTTEIVKASYDIISPYIVSLFNNLFDNSKYPENWGLGYTIPIFKGGDSKDATNYRGITLNNILAKIYSLVLLNPLTAWSEKHNKISGCQFGYQKGRAKRIVSSCCMLSFQRF